MVEKTNCCTSACVSKVKFLVLTSVQKRMQSKNKYRVACFLLVLSQNLFSVCVQLWAVFLFSEVEVV